MKPTNLLHRWTRPPEAMRHLRGSNIEEHVYPGAQHEVFNEINKDEVLENVVSFLRRALEFDQNLRGESRAANSLEHLANLASKNGVLQKIV